MVHNTDWFPGRVSNTYRDNYSDIQWSVSPVCNLEHCGDNCYNCQKVAEGQNSLMAFTSKELQDVILGSLSIISSIEISGMYVERNGGQKAFREFCVNHNLNYSMVQEYDAYIVKRGAL